MFSVHVDATVSRDRVRLTNSTTGQTVDRKCSFPFSSDHWLIANRDAASAFLKALVLESVGRSRLLTLWATANVSISGEPNSPADKVEVRQLFVVQGFTEVNVI